MPAHRKLFIAHASELAYRCVRAVSAGGLVAGFVRSYTERYNRRALSLNPERNREFESTIGREALLVMAGKVRRMLPAAFAEASLGDAFFAEFLASLGRSLEWPPVDAASESAAFLRDLEIYRRWTGRQRSAANNTAASESSSIAMPSQGYRAADHPWQSPFADRCALLLDPAMMEQARRASAEFEAEISRAAARLFSQLGRPSRKRSSTRRQKKRRRAAPAKRSRSSQRIAHRKLSRKVARHAPPRKSKPSRKQGRPRPSQSSHPRAKNSVRDRRRRH